LILLTGLSQLTEENIYVYWKSSSNPDGTSNLKDDTPTFHVCFNRIDLPIFDEGKTYNDFQTLMDGTLASWDDVSFTGEV